LRIYTGLGIGGMLSTTNAIVAEVSNNKRRGLCVSMMVIGYPQGGVICGALGKYLLAGTATNWRVMFTAAEFFQQPGRHPRGAALISLTS